MQIELLLNTALLPGTVALVIAWISAHKSMQARAALVIPPLAILCGCWLGLWLVSGSPVWWPDRAVEFTLLLPLIPLLLALWPAAIPLWLRSGLFLLGWSAVLAAIYRPLSGDWNGLFLAAQWLMPLAAAFALSRGAAADKWQDLAAILPLVVLAPVTGIGGSLLIGQIAGVFASTLGAVWLLACIQKRPLFADWRLLTLGSAATLAMVAYHYAEVQPLALALALLPTLASRLGPQVGIRSGWPLWLWTLLATALSLSAALWWIWPEEALY